MQNFFKNLGFHTLSIIQRINFLFAFSWSILSLSLNYKNWNRAVRGVFFRQILFTGVEALKFLMIVALMTGISVIVQAEWILKQAGQSNLLGPILVSIIIRELAPLVTNVIVLARSGTAIATEIGNMRVTGEIDLLDSQGIDSIIYLIMPRIVSFCISVLCLSIFFIFISLASGYIFSKLIMPDTKDLSVFINNILGAIQPKDIYNLITKNLFGAFFVASICSIQGLRISGTITEVPQAVTKAVEFSIAALVIISAIVSILTYI
ncbi:MAG: ABC-type transport system involved in resitance to organic solvents, permease protein [uncultured bacterium]|nr:MAG: ABC-type transport system involved in resitance to organic solvents, permease protein [uncultured bacterium]